MNKKILCLILSVILPLSLFIPVLAQSTINVDINLENYEITVEGNVGLNSAGHMVTMAISKANHLKIAKQVVGAILTNLKSLRRF